MVLANTSEAVMGVVMAMKIKAACDQGPPRPGVAIVLTLEAVAGTIRSEVEPLLLE